MSESFYVAITAPQIFSSILGYCGTGVAIACFVPLILANAAQRRNGTGGLFLLIWLIADVVNLTGIILLGAPLHQIFLAAWYFIADAFLGIELLLWGHEGWLAKNPNPAKTLLKKRRMEKEHAIILKFDEQFESWSFWDNAKLVASCIFLGCAWWGIYLVAMIYSTNGKFEIEIPTEHSLAALALGATGTALFTAARIPELVEGYRRDKKGKKPTQDLSDGVFVFLIMENVFNLAGIFALAFDPSLFTDEGYDTHYLLGELPWIAGGFAPIVLDLVLVVSIIRWQAHWKKRSDGDTEAIRNEEKKISTRIDHLKTELLHLEELKQDERIRADALLQRDKRNRKVAQGKDSKWHDSVSKPLKKAMGRDPEKEPKAHLYDDYLKHNSQLHDRAEQYGHNPRALDHDLSSSDEEKDHSDEGLVQRSSSTRASSTQVADRRASAAQSVRAGCSSGSR